MNALMDPHFNYPDLVATTEGLVAGRISMNQAAELARKVTGGELRETSVGRALVVGPRQKELEILAKLQMYCNAHGSQTPERWAAFFLMIESQLGLSHFDSSVAAISLSNALAMLDKCVKATGSRCPATGVRFAVQTVDSILANPACIDPILRKRLGETRASFKECGGAFENG
jgi:hypothetical protein